jgi:hypothetical protein
MHEFAARIDKLGAKKERKKGGGSDGSIAAQRNNAKDMTVSY